MQYQNMWTQDFRDGITTLFMTLDLGLQGTVSEYSNIANAFIV